MKHRFKKGTPLLPVEGVPKTGQYYHVDWGRNNGVVGVCISVNEENKTVILRTPKTYVEFKNPVNWKDLRHTRKTQAKLLNKK